MGHVRKERGRYRARYRDPLGRPQSKTFTRKADAERFILEVELDKQRGNWIDPRDGDLPLAVWADTFLSLARRLSPTTQDTYRRDLERYILPRFGSYRLGRLPAEEIEQWLNDEVASGIAASSVHRHYRTLRRMLAVAVQKQKIVHNACDRVDPPRVPKREMTFLNWDQSVRLAEAHNERFRPMLYVAVDTGMRWGELIGLRRASVDVSRYKIRVTEQLVQLTDRSFVRRPPKTAAGRRSITVSPFTANILSEHLERSANPGPDGLVFPNAAGNPLSASSFQSHHFDRAQRLAGVSCRFHDLRHTSVALAIAAGAHPKAIQARMGHASINVTLDRYGHLLPELDEAIAQTFGRELEEAHRRRASNVIHAAFGNGEHRR
jgi:integrase